MTILSLKVTKSHYLGPIYRAAGDDEAAASQQVAGGPTELYVCLRCCGLRALSVGFLTGGVDKPLCCCCIVVVDRLQTPKLRYRE